MTDEVVGRVADPSSLDFSPIELTIAGYTNDRQEVTVTIKFRRRMPMGITLDILTAAGEVAALTGADIAKMLYEATYDDDEARKLDEFIRSRTVNVTAETLGAIYKALVAHWTNRPSSQRSSSRGGGVKEKPTTGAAASSRASTSTRSRRTSNAT